MRENSKNMKNIVLYEINCFLNRKFNRRVLKKKGFIINLLKKEVSMLPNQMLYLGVYAKMLIKSFTLINIFLMI